MGTLTQSTMWFCCTQEPLPKHTVIPLLFDFLAVSVVMAITGPRVPGRWPLSFKISQAVYRGHLT